MARGGIPPSIDRQDRLVSMIVAGALLLAVFLGALYAVVQASRRVPDANRGEPASGESRLEAYLAEKERASAYAVVRDTLDQKKEEPGVRAVFCRDSRHQWVNGEIEFRGDVDFEGSDGRMRPHTYAARLAGSAKDGWTVESLQVSPSMAGAGN